MPWPSAERFGRGFREKTGFAFSGAGAGSGNTIRNTIEAAIKNGSTVTTTGTGEVSLSAMDASTIIADAGGVAIAVGASGQETGGAVSIGVSIADNVIENQAKAYIDDPQGPGQGRVRAVEKLGRASTSPGGRSIFCCIRRSSRSTSPGRASAASSRGF